MEQEINDETEKRNNDGSRCRLSGKTDAGYAQQRCLYSAHLSAAQGIKSTGHSDDCLGAVSEGIGLDSAGNQGSAGHRAVSAKDHIQLHG